MWLDGDSWKALAGGFKRRAFRLETQQIYRMAGEEEEFNRFLQGETPSEDYDYPWRDFVQEATSQGKTIERVHVVTPPLSDYLRYQFEWGYAYTVPVGEDVRILDLSTTPNPGLPEEDFWIFDDAVVRMLYRPDGTQIGRKLVEDPDALATYERYRKLAIKHSVPFNTYWPAVDVDR
jgi:uncharacterized protein DUF6879